MPQASEGIGGRHTLAPEVLSVKASVSCVTFLAADQIILLPILSVASFSHRVPRTPESTGNKRKLISWPVRLVESRALVSARGGGSATSSSPVRLEQRFHAHQNLPPRRRSLCVWRGSNCIHISRYEECIAIDRRWEAVGPRVLFERGVVRGRILFC